MENTKKPKVSLALDPVVLDQLDYLVRRIGISRSALVSELLLDTLPLMVELYKRIPEAPTPQEMVRSRGESAKIVQRRMDILKRIRGETPDMFLDGTHD
jgi:hypothetical protein